MPELEKVLNVMHELVGADISQSDFDDGNWVLEHSWTLDKENSFREWLVDYLVQNDAARKELCASQLHEKPITRKHINSLERFADQFIFIYGWKIERTEEDLND